MKSFALVDYNARAKFVTATGAAAVVLTLAADPAEFWVIDWVTWSYAGDPAAGHLQIEIDGVVVWQIDITSGGPGHLEFECPIYAPVKGKALVVTLADGGIAGSLNVRYR